MFRKSVIALTALASISAAAIAIPTEASAKPFYYRHAGRVAFGTAVVVTTAAVASSCWRWGWYRGVYVRQWVCY